MKAADELAKHVGVKPACAALEVSRSTLYRRRGPSTVRRNEARSSHACSERFVDRSPAEVVATLLDEEVEVPVQERRAQRTHPEYKKPELMA